MLSPFLDDEAKLAAVRAALPALGSGIYLNTGSAGPLPAEVAAAMADVEAYERDVGRAHYDYYLDHLGRRDEARASVAAVIGAGLDEIALTHSATEGMNIATWGLDWRPGDRVVTTHHEHAGGLGPLLSLRDRGVEVAFAELGDATDPNPQAALAAFDAAITPGTRLVSTSHVLWTTGLVLPIAEIAALAHARGAIVAIDGAQAVGAMSVRVPELGVDAYAVAAQKWLLGPEGMGALWVDPAARDRIRPAYAGWFAFASIDPATGTASWQPDGRRYEATNWHKPSVVGFARAIGWLSMFVGLEYVHRRGLETARAARERLAAIPNVEVLTPAERMATLVTFRIGGWPAQAALDELAARCFAIARTITQLDALRISVGFFTSDAELERFAETVDLLAAHTPESLPPRRTLPLFGAS